MAVDIAYAMAVATKDTNQYRPDAANRWTDDHNRRNEWRIEVDAGW